MQGYEGDRLSLTTTLRQGPQIDGVEVDADVLDDTCA
jgi:hypothetical protein